MIITPFDDFMVHQTSNPVAQPGPTDRNFYDRYWFNGFDPSGEFLFEVGLAAYPNRKVMDAHFTVSTKGVQTSLHASRRAPMDRRDGRVGPLRIEIVEAIRVVRVRIEPNETGIECDLVFRARTTPHLEPKNVMYDDLRCIMDTSRFTQLGGWEGWFRIAGERRDLAAGQTLGIRDKSWGVRPVGEPEAGAPGLLNKEPGVYWVWCPIFWDGFCTQFGTFEDRDGTPTQVSGAVVPLYESTDRIPAGNDPGVRDMAQARHRVHWRKGTRLAERAEIEFVTREGERMSMELEPLIRLHLLGLGYQHPEWGHGFWKGEAALASETWKLDDLDLLAYKHIHNHQVCRARMGDRVGTGTLETIVFGRHEPSGFKGMLDGAP